MAHEKVDFMTPEPEVFLYKETNNQIIRHFNKEVSKKKHIDEFKYAGDPFQKAF